MLPGEICRNLYYKMLRIRLVEEAIADEYKNQEMRCPVHLCIGQEAISAGICLNLKREDVVMSNHRSHGHYLGKGGSLPRMIAEIYGKEGGCSKGRGGSQHLVDLSVNFYGSTPIVGGTIPVATGVAWAARLKNEKKMVVVFFGDAAVEEGVFHESLNFASLHQLPILYVCENNFYSIFTHITKRQPNREINLFVKAHNILAMREDGNDLLAVYKTGKKAIDYIRRGSGPAFIEFLTYRHKEHCGPNDDPPGFRPDREIKGWKTKDPIIRMENYLKDKGILDGKGFTKMKTIISKELDKAFKFARKSPYARETPDVNQVFA